MNWLNNAIVYQIFPASFYDINGDGIGDIRGIIEKLDYISGCGFTAIWLNPINASTFYDAGYDVTDYYSVAERYGTINDYKELCEEAHARGMKIIFDLVAGHTSIDHPWFKESAKNQENEYTNRYIWTCSTFDDGEGVAGLGERDAKCVMNFFNTQPALNYGYAHPDISKPWQLPVTHPDCVATKNELKRIIDFWMDMGTDAFRVDMAASLIKGDTDGSYMSDFWHEIRAHIESRNPECLLISEWDYPRESINSGFHLDFLLHSGPLAYTSLFRYEKGRNTTTDKIGHSYFNSEGKGNINDFLDRFLYDLEGIKGKGYVGLITGNHDMPRLAYRRTVEEIKAAMIFLYTMPGVPFVYYGDEIGMDYIEGLPSKEGGYLRTGSRTPMQWSNDKNHGFSDNDNPYLPTDDRGGAPTVEEQEKDETSLLVFVKKLAAMRKENYCLWADADFGILMPGYPFVFERMSGSKKMIIGINPSKYRHYYEMPRAGRIILSQNIEVKDDCIVMDGISFVVIEQS